MTEHRKKRVPWLLYPFWLVWRLVIWIIEGVGRLAGAIIGLVLMVVGVIVSLTVVGLIVGVPLFAFGLMLVGRSLF
jgi:hypothetical protein